VAENPWENHGNEKDDRDEADGGNGNERDVPH
jgi:hypothetical protein